MKRFSILDKLLIAGCIALMVYSITGCARKITGTESGMTTISTSSLIASAKLAAATDHATLTITAADINPPIVQPLLLIAGTLVGENISVPAGLQRRFTIEAFDKDGTLIYSGSITADITPGLTGLSINLRPAVPMVNLSPHFQQALFFGDTLGITDQLQDTFDIEIYVHNIDSLRSIDGYIDYDNGPFTDIGFLRGADLPANIYFGSEGTYFSVSIYDSVGGASSLTDANGDAHVATLRFYTYSDWSPDTAQSNFSMNVSNIYSISGDSISVSDVYTDDADILFIRPGLPPFQ